MTQPAYFIIDVAVHDVDGMKPYQQHVQQTFTAYGGKRLVMGGALDTLEGDGPHGRVVMVRFPSMRQARAWHDSPEYQAIIGHRLAAATSHAYIVEGEPQ